MSQLISSSPSTTCLIDQKNHNLVDCRSQLREPVSFPLGLPGFEEVRAYQFYMEENYAPFLFMDAVGANPLRFICIDSFSICPEYKFNIALEVRHRLELVEASSIAVLNIVTLGSEPSVVTANLMSPLIVNVETMIGEQVILENSKYSIYYPIWDSLFHAGQPQAAPAPCGAEIADAGIAQ
jgi:flagellar assembly factor FliW